ncbi:MAG TPA: FAD-dependent monooxygenase [Polyangiaceae bacterium]|nr:FAD-dependent monooxygenase [Polyangiaceae bacterium]
MPVRPLPAELTLELDLDDADDASALRARVARELRVPEAELPDLVVRKRSLDARRGRLRFHVLVELGARTEPLGGAPPREVAGEPRVIVVGEGPAGLFCAYELARRGVAALVVDRGKLVQPRRHDLKGLNRHGKVDPDSNYCFGEGGAGTYSDGKLYTRAHKRGPVRDVLELLALHGAPEAVLVEARPHIGSNRLPKVVTALRERLAGVGQVFRFGARVSALLTRARGDTRAVAGVRLADGSELFADAVVLATGHSARDVYELLLEAGVRLEAKPFALGVRIEHPQPLVNRIQYGRTELHPKLPNASYRLACQVDGRGVFSFCMCPGGWIVPASTEPGALVVNGMSLARRDSPFANSGLVVGLEPHDWEAQGFHGPLGGIALQRVIERAAFDAGGGELRAPAVRALDFVERRASSDVPDTSYVPGTVPADIASVLDAAGLKLAERIRRALVEFNQSMRGYLTNDAALVGVESRTSSPVRVPRHPETLESPDLAGLFPTGEGAGYAGGIVSAALDGMRVAERVAAKLAL